MNQYKSENSALHSPEPRAAAHRAIARRVARVTSLQRMGKGRAPALVWLEVCCQLDLDCDEAFTLLHWIRRNS